MTTYFVTRHSGAIEWLSAEFPEIATTAKTVAHWSHADTSRLVSGDAVVGILPIDIAANVCSTGARFFALSLPNLAANLRGVELSAEQMRQAGANITEYHVEAVPIRH